jgi:hypothetical protein
MVGVTTVFDGVGDVAGEPIAPGVGDVWVPAVSIAVGVTVGVSVPVSAMVGATVAVDAVVGVKVMTVV